MYGKKNCFCCWELCWRYQCERITPYSLTGSVLDVLSFAVENHTYHVKNYILSKELLQKVSEIDINKEIEVLWSVLQSTEQTCSFHDRYWPKSKCVRNIDGRSKDLPILLDVVYSNLTFPRRFSSWWIPATPSLPSTHLSSYGRSSVWRTSFITDI